MASIDEYQQRQFFNENLLIHSMDISVLNLNMSNGIKNQNKLIDHLKAKCLNMCRVHVSLVSKNNLKPNINE